MIFLDSGYFKALNDDKDPNHEESLKIESYLECSNEITVINTTVLVETLNRFQVLMMLLNRFTMNYIQKIR